MHFFKAFKENLENFKRPYVKRCEPVLGINKKAPVSRLCKLEAFHSVLSRFRFFFQDANLIMFVNLYELILTGY